LRHFPPALKPVCPVPAGFRADLPRWQQLVAVDWLAALLAGQVVAAPPGPHWLLLEVACDGLEAYGSGHIPGARYLDTRQFEQLPFWNVRPLAQLMPLLQQAGVGPRSTVILYARNMLAAARVAQILLTVGVADVRLLDGGLTAWCDAGHALRAAPGPQRAARGGAAAPAEALAPAHAQPPARFAPRPDYLIHTAQARALLLQPDAALVSIRTRAEVVGQTSGYSYIQARGEIAGALWGHAGVDGDINSMRNFQEEDGRMKPAAEITALWAEAGIRPDLQIAFYCGTGWRASLAFFYAWLMGWPRISVYDGGWFEWSSDAANPVICQTPEPRGPA
jgi:thiosulfate/3-mercaptopyruvate sulfurtransferase